MVDGPKRLLKPETLARLQGILDGTIQVNTTPQPADLSTLSAESRARMRARLGGLFQEVKAEVAQTTQINEEEHTMPNQEPDAQALRNADEVIKLLDQQGHGDYGAFRKEIALDIYDNGHYRGNWDATFDPGDYDDQSELAAIRVIQEDEYDQHMDEDEDAPAHDDMVGHVPNGYLWMV